MDKVKNISRRTALLGIGAVATVTGIATTDEAVAAVARSGAKDIDAQLMELTDRYIDAVKIIDPTIKGAWLGTDPNALRDENGDKVRPGPVVMSVYLERHGGNFVQPSNAKPTVLQRAMRTHRRAWQDFDAACEAGLADTSDPNLARLMRRETGAFARLLRAPAISGQEKAKKAEYVLHWSKKCGIVLEHDQVTVLLKSLAGFL